MFQNPLRCRRHKKPVGLNPPAKLIQPTIEALEDRCLLSGPNFVWQLQQVQYGSGNSWVDGSPLSSNFHWDFDAAHCNCPIVEWHETDTYDRDHYQDAA